MTKIASLASPSHYERNTASPTPSPSDASGDAVTLIYQHGDASDAIITTSVRKNFKIFF